MTKPLGITEVVLRDGHQSLLATRLRLEDMLPIAPKLDEIGFWSIESWGGATFDSCIRYLGEDPWERLRALKKAMPNTKQQMLFRGQNILGYRHYADDVVEKFVERAHVNGIDVFRIFDAMNDVRNLQTAIKSAVKVGAHAQGTLSYTESPVHTLEGWLTMAKQLEDMGAHSLCIKDMSGLLKPYDAAELIGRLKETVSLPIALHCHATTGLSLATQMKAIDADIDVGKKHHHRHHQYLRQRKIMRVVQKQQGKYIYRHHQDHHHLLLLLLQPVDRLERHYTYSQKKASCNAHRHIEEDRSTYSLGASLTFVLLSIVIKVAIVQGKVVMEP